MSRRKTDIRHDARSVRAAVTPDEHMALWRLARDRLGTTLGAFVKEAVRQHVERTCGTTLEKAAASCANAGRLVQMELF